ncbi:hypothetical protein ACFV8E_13695 [Streptomyces sp. NPDC059849]|uniref:hypothetical protein n=1 Tax=Streptomyces sp. NPDC059849 TaxID=3346969 RepID=UPI003667202B
MHGRNSPLPPVALNLRSGCCPDPDPDPEPAADGIPGRHLIRSRHFKNVTDLDGHHLSAGEVRAVPWAAITPVVHAIRVLEKMVPEGELLFSSGRRSGVLKSGGLNIRIKDFVSRVNREAATHNPASRLIPDDPHGPLQVSRFRRTLAWHIARRPGGPVALAIQYGHMRTVLDARTSSRYGARSRGGIHTVLDVETALAAEHRRPPARPARRRRTPLRTRRPPSPSPAGPVPPGFGMGSLGTPAPSDLGELLPLDRDVSCCVASHARSVHVVKP